jgi:phage terminase large subunit-like protein
VEAGNCFIPALSLDPLRIAPEWQDFLAEISRFPVGTHDDAVDAFVYGMRRLSKPLLVATTTEG